MDSTLSFAFLLLFPLLLFSFYLYSEQIYRDPFPNPMDLVDLFRQVTHHLFHKLMMKYFLFPFLFFSLKGQLNKITGREPFKTIISKVMMIPILEQVVVTMLLKLFKVPHPRVRLAAINATVQLSIHLRPVLPRSYYRFVLPALKEAIYNDPDRDVRLAAINATVQLSIHLGPVLLWLNHHFVLPALERAINHDPDRDVRLAAINATVQLSIHLRPGLPGSYHRCMLALEIAMCEHPDRDVKLAAINATVQLSIHLRLVLPLSYRKFVLPGLAALIDNLSNRDVSLAAINATVQLSIYLRPDLPRSYKDSVLRALDIVLQALAKSINYHPNRDVRLAAINATVQLSIHVRPDLPRSYQDFVLPALAREISGFEDPNFQAVSAMINISRNYPQETPRHLSLAVGTLLEKHASSRREIQEHRDIDWHEIRNATIEILVMQFEGMLPHDTWISTFDRLGHDQQEELGHIL